MFSSQSLEQSAGGQETPSLPIYSAPAFLVSHSYLAVPLGTFPPSQYQPVIVGGPIFIPYYVAPGQIQYFPFELQPYAASESVLTTRSNSLEMAAPKPPHSAVQSRAQVTESSSQSSVIQELDPKSTVSLTPSRITTPQPKPSLASSSSKESSAAALGRRTERVWLADVEEKKAARKAAKKYLKQKQKQQSTSFIQETLSQKVANSQAYQAHFQSQRLGGGHFASSLGSPFYAQFPDYSQYNLIPRINAFLQKNYCGRTSSPFYCNGLTMVWLLMMSWNVEPIFYRMIKEIVDCPFNKLHTIHKTILELLDWIDLGQNPERFSGRTCTQDDMDKIIGNIKTMTAIRKNFSQDRAAEMIERLATTNTILALGGYREGRGRGPGHTIGIFYKKNRYFLFDSDYRSGRPRSFGSAREAALEYSYRLFTVPGRLLADVNHWEFYVSYRPPRPHLTANDAHLKNEEQLKAAAAQKK